MPPNWHSTILFLIISQLIPSTNAITFYQWMEKNSFICQDNNSFEPSFLTDDDAIQFNCESLCGNPLLTNQACSRLQSEPNSSPICSIIPEICMLNFIQEFNDEKTFHLLLNPQPMDKELFKTEKPFMSSLIEATEEGSNDQDIDIEFLPATRTTQVIITDPQTTLLETTTQILTTTTTLPSITTEPLTTTTTQTTTQPQTTITTIQQTTTTTTQRTTSTEPLTTTTTTQRTTTTVPLTTTTTTQRTTSTKPLTTTTTTQRLTTTTEPLTTTTQRITQFPTTTLSTTTQRPKLTTLPQILTTSVRKSKTLIGFRVPLNAIAGVIGFTTPKHRETTTHLPPKITTTQLPIKKNFPEVDDKLAQDLFINEFRGRLIPNEGCSDEHISCLFWTNLGECKRNPKYMLKVCKRACNLC